MLKIPFFWLRLIVLIFTACIQHKADFVALQALLPPCRFSNFFLATFQSFIKWPSVTSCILLFLLNAIIGLLTNTLRID